MIVCSCNVLSDHQIKNCLDDPQDCPRNVSEVYGCLGCSPKCGRCAPTIQRIMNGVKNARTEAAADCANMCCSQAFAGAAMPAFAVALD